MKRKCNQDFHRSFFLRAKIIVVFESFLYLGAEDVLAKYLLGRAQVGQTVPKDKQSVEDRNNIRKKKK